MTEKVLYRPEDFQERLYSFPYHWLPYHSDDVWYINRYLWWGYRYLALLETVKSHVLAPNPRRVLDFGCGDGRLAVELADAGIPEVVGVDISETALTFARAFAQPRTITFASRLQDVSHQPFDVVVAMEVLEHLPPDQIDSIVKQIHQLQEQDGVFIVTTPTWRLRLSGKHYRHFSAQELVEVLHPWFRIQKLQYVHKDGILASFLQRLIVNRLFIANWQPWLRWMAWAYKRFVMKADSGSGLHLVAVLRRQ